ncbi:MAG: YbaB/EbfC family nucleoid-associated protein [Desulfovibrio sp.]|jgi:DNA-binding YbaB/EbfC family protein|nr:YbaB/EbfC family nucleoid-associated protein [Desulfovibrio sp.]
MQDMGDILRQAQTMQTKFVEIQEALSKKIVEGSSGGGMVRVICTGRQEIRSIAIDKNLVAPEDVEMLQDLVVAAVNTALRLSRELADREVSSLAGGLKIPGLF